MTIAEFLEARIYEDEAAASDAFYEGQRWAPEEESVIDLGDDAQSVLSCDRKRDATHASRWSPVRVLAECAAKRRIIGMHSQTEGMGYQDDGCYGYGIMPSVCTSCGTSDEYGTRWPCNTVRAIAAIYSGHPDYESEWEL